MDYLKSVCDGWDFGRYGEKDRVWYTLMGEIGVGRIPGLGFGCTGGIWQVVVARYVRAWCSGLCSCSSHL